MARKEGPVQVQVMSHGPHCLDGAAAAVVVASFHSSDQVQVHFSSNPDINEKLLALSCDTADGPQALWITDISWTDPAVDARLREFLDRGVEVYWLDHHRTAIDRHARGAVQVPFTGMVLSDHASAALLTYQYLSARYPDSPAVRQVRPLAEMADDNDRWIHRLPGSRRLALAVSALPAGDAFRELAAMGPDLRLTPALEVASERVGRELERSLEVAEATRVEHELGPGGPLLVAAVCDGYASEIGDRWGRSTPGAVFAFYDTRSLGVSLRRSPDCTVDLARLAQQLGGGGHPAAAGCEVAELRSGLANATLRALLPALLAQLDRK